MDYTPKGTYFDQHVSAEDKKAIEEYQKQWAAANAAGDEAGKIAAHEGAEAIRANYGYSGGDDGSEHLGMTQKQMDAVSAGRAAQTQAMLEEVHRLYQGSDSAYQQMLAQQKAANDAAVQKAINGLESRKNDTQRQYSDLFRQLYLDKMRNRKNLDQRLAAGGVTGGAAESTVLGYDSAYEDALRQGEQGRISALNDLDRAIADARLTGDIKNAEAAASTVKEQTDAYADTLMDLIARQDKLDAQRTADEREDAAAERSYAYKTAMQMISSGVMPPESLLRSAGIDLEAAQSMLAAIEAERAEKAQKEEEKASRPILTVAQVNDAIKRGRITQTVLDAYEYYYGVPYRR